MFDILKKLFLQLDLNQKKRYLKLQFLVIIMASFEVLAVASIGPFMAIVGDNTLINDNETISNIYIFFNSENVEEFIFHVGLLVLVLLIVSSIVSIFTSWRLSLFASDIGTEFSNKLYRYYINQNWLFHTENNSAQLTKNISTESMRVSDAIIQPFMQLNAKLVLSIFILVGVILYNPQVAIFIFCVFALTYLLIYKIIKRKLGKNGEAISNISTVRFKLMNEGFGGIKDILLYDKKDDFINRFEDSSKVYAYSRGTNIALGLVPKYIVEFIAFGTLIGIILILLKMYNGELGLILPVLSVYALAIFKLLPALQYIYFATTQIKGSIPAFKAIEKDLLNYRERKLNSEYKEIKINKDIYLKNIIFSYPDSDKLILNNVSLKIPKNKTIGIVGPSGSGKSTLIDILLTLVIPNSGQICVDDIEITDELIASWKKQIGFVPQNIFISEASIAENIAFGIPLSDIDINRVNEVIKLSHLDEFISTQCDGIYTLTGERGVKLSGGQRQRIAIARALYRDPQVLVFDEATSALDGITEKLIMDAVNELSGNKTIIMIAHRLKTVEKSDVIYYINRGRIEAEGSYCELLKSHENFKRMTEHA